REACHYCVDLTSELADISVGSIGSASGWSTTIVRTNIGEKIFENAVKEGYLRINEKPINVEIVEKLSKRKKSRNSKAAIEKYQKSPNLPPHYYFSIKELAQKKKVNE
ncbi:MAG: Coenzyme F420 hydrogenase/dehydrogenase, beta subunit C-terminal domain, partial [Promethearchaeota archaeon]